MIVTADHETGGLAITMGKTKGYEIVAGFNTEGIVPQWFPFLVLESFQNFSEEFMTIPKSSIK